MNYIANCSRSRARMCFSLKLLFALIGVGCCAPSLYATQLYWSEDTSDKIRRVESNGTGATDIITSGLGLVRDVEVDPAGGKIYWTDSAIATQGVYRANLDGTGVQALYSPANFMNTHGLGLDPIAGHVYWVDSSASAIRRADLDGSNQIDILTPIGDPFGLTVDPAGGHLYWTDANSDTIRRAKLDGTDVQTIVSGLNDPLSVALDLIGNKMYWVESPLTGARVARANLDGTVIETLVSGTAVGYPYDIEVDAIAGRMYWTDVKVGYRGIWQANLDGSGAALLPSSTYPTFGLAVVVPEPSGLVLSAMGLFAILMYRWRR